MKRLNGLLALGTLVLLTAVAALAILNWPALSATTTWQLGFAEAQWPVGGVVLLLAAVLFVPLLVAYLSHLIGTMIDTRRMLLEVQRLQKLADQAEASRIDGLRAHIDRGFERLHVRLDTLPTGVQGTAHDMAPGPTATISTTADPAGDSPSNSRAVARSHWFKAAP